MGNMDLSAISSNPDQKPKAAQYKEVLEELVNKPSVADMKVFIDHSAFTIPASCRSNDIKAILYPSCNARVVTLTWAHCHPI
jgi:hypothetical protein